jgi:hypothetical protein
LPPIPVIVDVVHPSQTRHVAEHRIMRPGNPAKQSEHRQRYCHRNPVQDTDDQHSCRGSDCQNDFTAAETADPTQLRNVNQPQRRENHNGSQRSQREAGKNRPECKQRKENDGQRDEGMKLSAAAGGIADRRPAAAAAHREALKYTG